MFGWPSLETVMTDYGIFSNLCNNEPAPCDSQKLRFRLVYTVGVYMNTVTPVAIGYFADRYGPKVTNVVGTLTFAISSMLFSVSLLYNVDLILFAFALMTGAGPAISLSIFHFSNLFPGYELTIMSSFSGIFTISSLVFPMFEVLYNSGIHLGYSFGGFVLVLLPICLTGYYFFPFASVEQARGIIGDAEQLLPYDASEGVVNKRQQVRRGTFKEQVIQKDFWLVIAFLAVQSLRVAMYVGTLNDRFASDSIYIKIFPFVWPSGIIFIPVVGRLVNN
jgi:MFS family permease